MDMIKFRKKIYDLGGSGAITLPPEILNFLEVKSGDEIVIIADKGKYGKFAALFKEQEVYEFSELKK